MMFFRRSFAISTAGLLLFAAPALTAAGYEIDRSGSSITFVAPSRLGDVEGVFHKWRYEGTIDEDFNAQGKIVVDVASIDTNNRRRDDHLRNPDFFEVEKYPTAVFTIQSVSAAGAEYRVKGSLNMHGVTKPIAFTLRKEGLEFKGGVVINRVDYKIDYQSVLNPIDDQISLRIKLKLKAK